MSLAWVAVGTAVVGAAGAAYSSNKAAGASKSATRAQERSAADATNLGREQLAFDKQVYNEGAYLRTNSAGQAVEGMYLANRAARGQMDEADKYARYREGTYEPLEKRLVAEAQGFDTPERRAAAMEASRADVEGAFGSAAASLNRNLGRAGVIPGSGRSVALLQDASLAKAGALAGATTGATRNVETMGSARMMDAASLGRNLPSSQVAAVNSSMNAVNTANASGAAAINAQQSGAGLVNQGYSGAMQGASTAGSLYGQVANRYAQQAQDWAKIAGQAGQAAGSAWMYASDEKKKKGRKRVKPEEVLDEIERTPVEEWAYDPEKGGPDDGGVRHTGPMAQRVRTTMGESVAPGGKEIDIVSMNGKLMAGMQALSKKVSKLEKRRAA